MAVGWCYVDGGELHSCDKREQVLGLHENRSITEFHLHRILSSGKVEALRGRRLLFVVP